MAVETIRKDSAIEKAEDAAGVNGDIGVVVLGQRTDSLFSRVGANGDYGTFVLDDLNRLHTRSILVDEDGVSLVDFGSGGNPSVRIVQPKIGTFSAAIGNISVAAAATDVFTIVANPGATQITKIGVTGTQTTAGQISLNVLKRSTLNTGGTSTVVPSVNHGSASSFVQVRSYTANPALGTLVGLVRSVKVQLPSLASGASGGTVFEFGDNDSEYLSINAISTVLYAVNLDGATITGGSFSFFVEWLETA